MPGSKEAFAAAAAARDQLAAMLDARPLLPGTLDELGRDILDDLADVYRDVSRVEPIAARGRLLDVASAIGELQALTARVPPHHVFAGSEPVQAEALERVARAISAIDADEPFVVERLLEADSTDKGRLLLVITDRIVDVPVSGLGGDPGRHRVRAVGRTFGRDETA